MLHNDRGLHEKLRCTGLRGAPGITWAAAGVRLLQVYEEVVQQNQPSRN